MHTVVGPVITRKGGYAFDSWTDGEGLNRSFSYLRVEDAYYARKAEIRSHTGSAGDQMIVCSTLDEFASALAARYPL
jgi:hypothetical protein